MCTPHKLPLVVSPMINNCQVGSVLVNDGCSSYLLFVSTLAKTQIPYSKIKPVTSPFFGIVPQPSITPIDQIVLLATLGDSHNFRIELITFDIVDFESAYNAILGRPSLTKFMAVTHHAY